MNRLQALAAAVVLLCLSVASATAQQQQQLPDGPQPQADRPTSFPAPDPTVPSRPVPNDTNPQPSEQLAPSEAEKAGGEPLPAPKPNITTVRQGQATPSETPAREQLYTLTKEVSFVFVPVTVKDTSGRLVPGLTKANFSVLENDQKQRISYFTSDPFPISAAVVIDVGMADIALKKVADTFGSLNGAFSQFDEVAVYTFGNTVRMQQDFVGAVSDKLTLALRRSGSLQGRGAGPLVPNTPMTAGPSVNGRPFGPGVPDPALRVTNEPSRVLNDAILRAALDLSRRDRTRRKMVFVISDGLEKGSTASYSDVLRVLLSNEVSVYAVAVDQAAMPAYSRVNKIHLPRQAYGNILPKYASATGGEVFTEFTKESIEQAYAGVTEQARNQYTIGYSSPTPVSASAGVYRGIEIRVDRPGLKIYARDGYYPLPPARK